MNVGFFHKQTEAERLFSMVLNDNYELLMKLDSTQRKLNNTEKKLERANAELSSMGVDVSNLGEDVEENRSGLMETYEVTLDNSSDLEDCRTAIMEIYEMIGE